MQCLEIAHSYSSDGSVLIEEYLPGSQYSVESITYQGNTSTFQITEYIHMKSPTTAFPYNYEYSFVQPARISSEQEDMIKQATARAIAALGLDNTATHTEIKLDGTKCQIIELGARLGGDFIGSVLIDLSTGISLEEAVIRVAMGEEPVTDSKFQKCSINHYLNLPTGHRVIEIHDLTEVLEMPCIHSVRLYVHPGMDIPYLSDSKYRSASIIASADTPDALFTGLDNAVGKLKEKIILEKIE